MSNVSNHYAGCCHCCIFQLVCRFPIPLRHVFNRLLIHNKISQYPALCLTFCRRMCLSVCLAPPLFLAISVSISISVPVSVYLLCLSLPPFLPLSLCLVFLSFEQFC